MGVSYFYNMHNGGLITQACMGHALIHVERRELKIARPIHVLI